MILKIIFVSRSGDRFALALIVFGVIAAGLSRRALKIDLTQQYMPALMVIPELCAVLMVCLSVLILRPRLWFIDRFGAPTRRWVPSLSAVIAGVFGPQVVLIAGVFVGLSLADFHRSAANILFFAGLAFMVAPFLGAFVASGLTLMLYFGLTCALQMEPGLSPWSPMTISTSEGGKWVFAIITTVAALSVTAYTLGRTPLTWGRDLDLA